MFSRELKVIFVIPMFYIISYDIKDDKTRLKLFKLLNLNLGEEI